MMYSENGVKICPLCGGSGLIVRYRSTPASRKLYGDDREIAFDEPCPECNGGLDKKILEIKSRSNIPQSFYDSNLDDFKWDGYTDKDGKAIDLTTQKEYVTSFVNDYDKWDNEGLGFYIFSHCRGSGKTFLASCICNELVEHKKLITKFVNAINLKSLAQSEPNPFEKNPIDQCCEAQLLVLDDLGAKMTEPKNTNDLVYKIIDYRYQHKLVTIITSNMSIKELNLDDRITDRIYKLCQQLPLPEMSYRTKQGHEDRNKFLEELGLIHKKGEG